MGESIRNNDQDVSPPIDLTRNLFWTSQVMPSDWNWSFSSNEFACFFFVSVAVPWRNILWVLNIRRRLSKRYEKWGKHLLQPLPAMELHQSKHKRGQDVQVIRCTDESNNFYVIMSRVSLEWVCWVSATCSNLFTVEFPPWPGADY